MKKIILIAAGAVILLGSAGAGAYFYFAAQRPHIAKPAPPKPIYFAQLGDLVVTVPADSGDSTTAFVQITLQFSSFDTNAVTEFTNLQPIIKSEIINMLMQQTAKSLMDPTTHDALLKTSLDITNKVLNKSANYTPPNPFTAAYITNIVEQN